ncbi:maleylpyruvate isomerase family mycothiol-dependent enzyme [Nocardioides anomalus]|uniref:Maleylpyruvate isomerase family mycothiol-dependent enzyme n=1 Tax=Nocardioides anomalus TaxID=2712223 RepID=A0A6G6W9K7_9ACTN|nr:maleylpyruvate isomerase family mycothiol-dependent enzyme [Nocardioides anomalus]QIG41914.1 maleylpyruvate isomerase family mycothiol-dependent enzyme [Nocardioides anomalus]
MAADWDLVVRERAALVELFGGLQGDQWAVPSLCPGWSVQDVLAHLASVLDASARQSLWAVVRGRGWPPAVIEQLTRVYADRPPADLVAAYRRHTDSTFGPPVLGWRASLTDVMVHRADVAVPLGLTLDRPPAAWRPVLEFLTSAIPMMGSIRGGRPHVTWRATDLDWSSGSGPEVTGPADAIGPALAGRAALLDRLEGPGLEPLAAWLR